MNPIRNLKQWLDHDPLRDWGEDNGFILLKNGSFLDDDGHVWPREWVEDYVKNVLKLDIEE